MKKKTNTLKNNLLMAKYVFKFVPSYFFVKVFEQIFYRVIFTAVGLLFTKQIYTFIEELVTVESPDFMPVVWLFVMFIGVNIILMLLSNFLYDLYYERAENKFSEKMQRMIYDKAFTRDLSFYDNPGFYDDFTWSMQRASGQAMSSLSTFIGFFTSVLSAITIVSIIASLDWFAIVIVIIYVAISYLFSMKMAKINFKKAVDLTPVQRKISYVNRLFYLDTYAKEMRLTGLSEILLDKYNKNVTKEKELNIKNINKNFFLDLFSTLSTGAVWDITFTLVLVFRILVSKTLTLAGMMTIQNAANSLSGVMYNFLDGIKQFRENALYIEKFKNFMEADSELHVAVDAHPVCESFESLELKNLGFKYASQELPTLYNINMKINKNEKIAIVGYNGAGKSTLIKLILRLYEKSSGEILYNGENVENIQISSYREQFGTVFQDYHLFAAPLCENVLLDEYDESKRSQVEGSLHEVTFDKKLSQLPHGIETMLTREFDDEGVILSGGEAQKVAISRTIAKPYDFIIMDEPSSALDVDSEYELNKLMMSSTADKTVIFISHRLSTTRMADRIFMMENGRIIESGSHDELIRLGGKYAEMFNKQAEKYIESCR